MSAVVSIFNNLPIRAERPSRLTARQQEKAESMFLIAKPAIEAVLAGASVRAAVAELYHAGARGLPSEVTLRRFVKKYKEGGFEEAVDKRLGRQREVKGCEALILEYWQRPSQPSAGTISFWLKQDHDLDVPGWWIRRYIASLPSNQAETSPKRLGKHFYDQTIRPHHRRDPDDIDVGEVMVSDGHRIKFICYHPITGDLFRAEVTPVLDKRSNYCYAFWVGANESAMDTVYALCSVMARYDQVPAWFQTDPGPGFLNRRTQALFARLSITHVPTRAGNARGKDFGEGFFRIFKERFAKRFDTYCGDDRTDDALARMRTKVKRGEIRVPSFAELKDELEKWRVAYNAWPQPYSERLKGKAPIELIANIKRNPLAMPAADLLRPFVTPAPTVRHWEVRFRNRFYRHPELAKYERRKVIVQYDEHDESKVWVRDAKHRLICVAPLVQKIGWAKESVAADVREKSRQAAVARAQNWIDEVNDRAAAPLSAVSFLDALDSPAQPQQALPGAGEQLMAQGHSFTLPSLPAAAQRPVRAIAAQTINQLREEQAEAQAERETAQQRYARAQELLRRVHQEQLCAEDAQWLAIYCTSSEYHARRLLDEEFGTTGEAQ